MLMKGCTEKSGDQQCKAENTGEYGIMTFSGRNIEKKIMRLRLRITGWVGLRITGS
jgi:hypothetical protein